METPAANAQIALAVLVAHADGHLDPSEAKAISERAVARLGATVDVDGISQRVLAAVAAQGLRSAVTELARDLPSALGRMQAMAFAVDVAYADGRLDEAEIRRILTIGECLGIDPKGAQQMLRQRPRPSSGERIFHRS
ncbi:MAG: TerB family tellurite resistance protein [Thermoplasmatota archaeon]